MRKYQTFSNVSFKGPGAPYQAALKILITAMREQKQIEFVYHDFPRLRVEPYILGFSTQGNLILSCYQNAGASEQGGVPSWKNVLVSDIRSVRLGKRVFTPREDYNPDDPIFENILMQV